MSITTGPDASHGDYERIACIVFCAVTPVFVLARCWSRATSKQFAADDLVAIVAFLFVLSCTVQTLVAFDYGWGHHVSDLDPRQLRICLILHWTFQLTYKISVACNKTSILLLYKRILVQRSYQIIIWALLSIVALFAIATSIAGVFQCVPVDKAWDKHIKGHCYNLVDAWYSNAVFSIVTDLLILMLPMHMLWGLQVQRREKLLLAGIFGLGIFVTFTSVMRFFALKTASSSDTTYDIKSGFWSVVEINVGVICVSLPPLRSWIARHLSCLRHKNKSDGGFSGTTRLTKNRPLNTVYSASRSAGYKHGLACQPGTITKETQVVIIGRERTSGERPSDEIELDPFERELR